MFPVQVKTLLRFLINNTFVLNGGKLQRQTVGIPMGTNAAPPTANCYLYTYEADYMDSLDEAIARMFQFTFRLIDDVLSVNNPHFQDALNNNLYPASLTLIDTSLSHTHVTFDGMSITYANNRLHLDIYDKRADFPFRVIRLPHLDSYIPTHLPYGSYLGSLVRLYNITTTPAVFLSRCVELATTLLNQGCSRSRLFGLFRSFLSKRSPLRWRRSFTVALCRLFSSALP